MGTTHSKSDAFMPLRCFLCSLRNLSLRSQPSLLQSCNAVQILLASDKPPSKSKTPPDPSPEDSSLTCDLTVSVCLPPNFSHQSSTLISSPAPSSHHSDPPPFTPTGSPKHLPPYSPSTMVTLDPEPSAPQEPTPPALPSAPATPSPFSSPPACPFHL
jgi:hypothetical protein